MDARPSVDAVAAKLSPSPTAQVTEPSTVKSAVTGTPNGLTSSPPFLRPDVTMDTDLRKGSLEESGEKSDSEAETIVLPGKDGHSPSKIRKSIKHEDKSEDEEMKDAPDVRVDDVDAVRGSSREKNGEANEAIVTSSLGKRKRSKHGNGSGVGKDDVMPGNSSGLSSVPTSPVATTRSSLSKPAASDSEISRSPSPRSRSRSSVRDKAKSVDRVLPQKRRYASGSGDDEEVESRRFGRHRSSGVDHRPGRETREGRLSSKVNNRDVSPGKQTRSVSPHSRAHRRSISNQLSGKSSHGLSHKKKRVPTPLQSTEYHSDESSDSGSSHPRSSRLRHLAAPTPGESTISPVKMPPHKKHVNSSGQTLLAIACSRNKIDNVKQRYEERPGDLNTPDNAMNTPLHIASLSGFTEIVKFLLDTGMCNLDSVNVEKDTPLHDAVDNKNVDVVKLLLDAGANPSKPNKAGNEPLDLLNVFDDYDDEEEQQEVTEMRSAIIAAKARFTADAHHKSEERSDFDDNESRMSRPRGSPRPASTTHHPHDSEVFATTKKSGTARSTFKTKDRALYQHLDVPTMRNAARDGDVQTISRILDVLPKADDAQTLYNAARGGHDSIVNLLFALGNFNPDPPVLEGVSADQGTPILAAIGKDNHLAIIELILGQPRFDPTRRFKGETYYEIAKRRAGPRWQEEVKLLKDAYNAYQSSHKSSPHKSRSPVLRREGREADRGARKQVRREEQSAETHKRTLSNPKTKDVESSKPQHKANPSTNHTKDGQNTLKRGPGRPRKEGSTNTAALSDVEPSPLGPPKQKSASRKTEQETASVSEAEPAVKVRRKLVSGKEFRGERELEKQRRASVASNTSSASIKEKRDRVPSDLKLEKLDGKSSPSVPRTSKAPTTSHNDHDSISERHPADKDRARSLKRDDSKDRLSAIRGESPVKRPRKSETPPRSNMQEVTASYGPGGGPQKRRRLDTDNRKAESTPSSSPERHTSATKYSQHREKNIARSDVETKDKTSRPSQKHKETADSTKDPNDSDKVSPKRPAKTSKPSSSSTSEHPAKKAKHSNERPSKEISEGPSASAKAEEAEASKQAQIRREKKAAELARQKELEEENEKERENERIQIEQARQERLAREEQARMEEEKRQREEAERLERQRLEDEEAHKRAEDEKKRLFDEQERLKREESERRRASQLEFQRAERARIEKQKREERLAKLPLLLRWFDLCPEPKIPETAALFRRIEGFRYDTIKPEATGQAHGREQWMLNIQAAILLGEKDLQLSRYTAWERIQLSQPQKRGVWSVMNGRVLLQANLSELRRKLPPSEPQTVDEANLKNRALFLDMDLFFVKVSEFMYVVPNFPHLHGLELQVAYEELRVPQTSAQLGQPFILQKWKQDPDTPPDQRFAPRPKYFVNGNFVRQDDLSVTRITKEAPPLDMFPRRYGITRVHPGESDYEEICKKQGLHHLLPGYQSSPPANPVLEDLTHPKELTNGITPPRSEKSRSINGGSPHHGSVSDMQASPQLPNGVLPHDLSPSDIAN